MAINHPIHRGSMTIYLIIVTFPPAKNGVVSVDVYESLEDAEARKARAEVNFPLDRGFIVTLLKKHVTPELSTVFS